MQILAHRGYWNENIRSNSLLALKVAMEKGFGFESDLRDYKGRMVISHNIADDTCPDAEEVFRWLSAYEDQYCFAINIKADGLKNIIQRYLRDYCINNYFLFDMSVPQMIEFWKMGLRFFTRQSEYETQPVLYEQAEGVWMDAFGQTDWINEAMIESHIRKNKQVCLVSPELHGRDYWKFWQRLNSCEVDFDRLLLCTDLPMEAKLFFADKIE